MLEAAPLWGFAAGTAAGLLAGLTAAFSGGPLGDGRLAAVGPSGLQVGLVAVLEIGVTAALAAGGANWLILSRAARRASGRAVPPPAAEVFLSATVDENTDPEGHRIYLNPWANEELPPRLQEGDPGVDGAGELIVAGLGNGNRVRLVQAG
jgi:Family of unknown function (DUF6350)